MATVLGIDFGTTNSVVAGLDTTTGSSWTVRFSALDAVHDVFRTVLCFWQDVVRGRSHLRHAAGPAAVSAYLEDPLESRLVMSMKTYLGSSSFTSTNLLGRLWSLEQLVGLFLRDLLNAGALDTAGLRVVAGRPVRFAGENADDALGERRLRAAFAAAGMDTVEVALEPEGAGYRFTRSLASPATVLIGDFGGGTSDFSVLRFTPGATRAVDTLGRAGIGIAGDTFDARIMDRVVAPLLGKGTHYAPWGNKLPVPAEWYSAFARWHRLSLMRTPRMMRDIEEVRRTAEDPQALDNLRRLIEDEQGYALYRAVSDAKTALSTAESTLLHFEHDGFVLERVISRAEFEAWIAPDLARLNWVIDDALTDAGVTQAEVDRVFLTGGTAFVPAVRALFEQRFGVERLSGGGEFVSVAEGLALIGAERLRAG
ncbi:MAG TPA: Hsp70 family protein [Acetobacteraceae bacterium]|nr:Hsp70 family protein [Acetobacteraceae bacterium]